MDFFSFSNSDWVQVDDTQKLFSQIDPIDGRLSLGSHVSLYERSLPIYENVRIICLTSDEWDEGLRICYLIDHLGKLFRLNGTSPPIHEVNAKTPIIITEENVLFYLSFFCFFVRGDEGPFYLVYDLEDELLPEGFADIHPKNRSDARCPRQLFRRPRLFGQNDKGNWRASGLIYYSNAVFFGDFLVQPTGMVELINDEPLLADLPCRINAPLAP